MEKCKYSKSDLARYLRSEMTRKEETKFQQHLLSCSACSKELSCMRSAVSELEQEDGSKKKWIVAVAIACSVAGGIYFSPIGQTEKVKSFEINHSDRYDATDSVEEGDSTFSDTIQVYVDDSDI